MKKTNVLLSALLIALGSNFAISKANAAAAEAEIVAGDLLAAYAAMNVANGAGAASTRAMQTVIESYVASSGSGASAAALIAGAAARDAKKTEQLRGLLAKSITALKVEQPLQYTELKARLSGLGSNPSTDLVASLGQEQLASARPSGFRKNLAAISSDAETQSPQASQDEQKMIQDLSKAGVDPTSAHDAVVMARTVRAKTAKKINLLGSFLANCAQDLSLTPKARENGVKDGVVEFLKGTDEKLTAHADEGTAFNSGLDRAGVALAIDTGVDPKKGRDNLKHVNTACKLYSPEVSGLLQ
jgi:hypothetical protein